MTKLIIFPLLLTLTVAPFLVFGLTRFALAEATVDNTAVSSDSNYQSILQRLQTKIQELEAMITALKKKLRTLNPLPGSCVITGCGGEVCAEKPLPLDTKCAAVLWPEYACYKTARCELQTSGQCGWTETTELTECLASKRFRDPRVTVSDIGCQFITKPLIKGQSGEEVKKLQMVLKEEGVFTHPKITGYYGDITKEAVAKFQARQTVVSSGTVDATTANELNEVYCQKLVARDSDLPVAVATLPVTGVVSAPPTVIGGGTVPPAEIPSPWASITVLSPNGGETWRTGETYLIRYQVTPANQGEVSSLPVVFRIYLEQGYPPTSNKTGVNSSLLIGETKDSSSFSYTVPYFVADWPGLGNNYKIRVCDSACKVSDTSDGHFTITTS